MGGNENENNELLQEIQAKKSIIINFNSMKTLIKNATIINEGLRYKGSVLINEDKIERLFPYIIPEGIEINSFNIIDAKDKYLIPGVIDDHVHFREPGLTQKGEIETESRAAIAGGITSFMDMPNTIPPSTTHEFLEKKYNRASEVSRANYSFYLGATNDNLEEVLKTDPSVVCGIKVFLGTSTGNIVIDDEKILTGIFEKSPLLIAAHCEDDKTIQRNIEDAMKIFGENIPVSQHPVIRSTEACYRSSSKAVELASKLNTRLHILHLSTAMETELFSRGNIKDKNITAEVCVHHLWFDERNYSRKGTLLKVNPAIKSKKDKEALWDALISDKIDLIATDHAPHTLKEKNNSYMRAPSGGPMIQHSLVAMLEMSRKGIISIEKVIKKMCHAPADLFGIDRRGYIREGYYADLVLVDPNQSWVVSTDNILYKCRWSAFENQEFSHKIISTFVNGREVYKNGEITENFRGSRLNFIRT
jgi:dihydroorotase